MYTWHSNIWRHIKHFVLYWYDRVLAGSSRQTAHTYVPRVADEESADEVASLARHVLKVVVGKVDLGLGDVGEGLHLVVAGERWVARQQHVGQYARTPHVAVRRQRLVVQHFRRYKQYANQSHKCSGDEVNNNLCYYCQQKIGRFRIYHEIARFSLTRILLTHDAFVY